MKSKSKYCKLEIVIYDLNKMEYENIIDTPYLIDEINNAIKNGFNNVNKLWREQEIEEKYKNTYASSNIKMYCCYYLVNEWVKYESNIYDKKINIILNVCKKDFEEINKSKFPNLFYTNPTELMKYYVYRKTEILIDEYLETNK